MNLVDLPPLREVLAARGLTPDKRFGQHFLLDLNICRKIARLAGVGAGDLVLEVGPGPGGLTRALLETGAEVLVVERDGRFAPILGELGEAAGGRLTVVEADALIVDEAALTGERPTTVVANLPYNVGTPLLVKWLTGPFRPASMTLMFQKEVAQRIVAPAGGEHYGRLAVLTQALCSAAIAMDLPARAFTPPPKVASAVVRLVPLAERPEAEVIDALREVARAAFGQRRKKLRSSLRALGGEALCAAAGVDADARAERVAVAGFLALAKARLGRE
ncbi:MAG TPA: 16S rRNA (adenine(1518)-N(6)/adenine(1519)-N(6))-dimethyltransferase RsmA [Caulobacteraceae bacterium]|nr:16S rRNA (adenine(1518)-N(6)/adenine(1519)-N(6))-dimethyltransferase RsmA [Caulobacteraceae bacterium]